MLNLYKANWTLLLTRDMTYSFGVVRDTGISTPCSVFLQDCDKESGTDNHISENGANSSAGETSTSDMRFKMIPP
jgi:hypothetical protein